MKNAEIRALAQRMAIAPGRMKKGEVIRAIQRKEGNNGCFGSGRARYCGEDGCLWREDCR